MVDVLHIVFSPRRIEESLVAHEGLGFKTAFLCGYTEHQAHARAWALAHEVDAEVYLLSYDDQVPTRAQADEVLEQQALSGDVVSGWQLLGMDSPFASVVHPEHGYEGLSTKAVGCFYLAEEVEGWPDKLVPTHYFPYALTALPREAMLRVPLRVLPQRVSGTSGPWYSRDGQPFDKGMCGDWVHSVDLLLAGYKLWAARDAHVVHLAPQHGVPAWPFFTHVDEPGVYWDRRPR